MSVEILFILLAIVFAGMIGLLIYVTYNTSTNDDTQPPVIGTILIETSDPDGPFLFLDLDMPIDQIGRYREVVCKVDTNGVVGNESE
jgi:hypothetical protein